MLIMIIGVPGTGKSTLANKMLENFVDDMIVKHYEADMFMVNNKGEYEFNPEHLQEAHKMCQHHIMRGLKAKHCCIVSNTSRKAWERKPYLDMARECKQGVMIIKLTKLHENIHGVPVDKVKLMQDSFEDVTMNELKGIPQVTFIGEDYVDDVLELDK